LNGEGNGAREALIEIAQSLPNETGNDAEAWTDWLLLECAMRGFVVVPFSEPSSLH
jgi:hypothetical protein